MFQALSDPLVYEHLNCAPPVFVDELSEAFSRAANGPPTHRRDERWIDFAVRLKTDGRWIGRLQAAAHPDWAEIAYLFGSADWGRGYATESLMWLHRCLRVRHGVSEFRATAAPSNKRSIRLLLGSGYVPAVLSDERPLSSYDPGDEVFRTEHVE